MKGFQFSYFNSVQRNYLRNALYISEIGKNEIKNMNSIKIYSQILRVKTLIKRIQQMSWNITQIDKKFNLDELNETDLSELLEYYKSLPRQLEDIAQELRKEVENV